MDQNTDLSENIFLEFNTRLNDIEEKQRILKDRTLLIGENLISTKESLEKQLSEIRKQLKDIEFSIKTADQTSRRIVNELNNLARKSELEILEQQAKIFQPLEFVRIEDLRISVKRLLDEESKDKNIKKSETLN